MENDIDDLNKKIDRINEELESTRIQADKIDYAVAVASGILAGAVDALFVGSFSLQEASRWGTEKVKAMLMKSAKQNGFTGDDPKSAAQFLVKNSLQRGGISDSLPFPVSDMPELTGGIQDQLVNFSHQSSVTGLIFSLLSQFTNKDYIADVSGEVKEIDIENSAAIGKNVEQKFMFGIIAWFFQFSNNTNSPGASDMKAGGVPKSIFSMAQKFSETPLFKNQSGDKDYQDFSSFFTKLTDGSLLTEQDENGNSIAPEWFNLETENGMFQHLGKQALPVLLNEVCVRTFYMLRRLIEEVADKGISSIEELQEKVDWEKIRPYGNRTIDRMITIASMTFSLADTAEAAVHAAVESAGNWAVFGGKFLARINYVGAGRTVVAVVKEYSGEMKEAQLLHEKMLLMETKTQIMYQQLQEFKEKLESELTDYLAKDLENFLAGFDDINKGIDTNNSDLVIEGNVTIQKTLGKESQFKSQDEFDDLMDSDFSLQL